MPPRRFLTFSEAVARNRLHAAPGVNERHGHYRPVAVPSCLTLLQDRSAGYLTALTTASRNSAADAHVEHHGFLVIDDQRGWPRVDRRHSCRPGRDDVPRQGGQDEQRITANQHGVVTGKPGRASSMIFSPPPDSRRGVINDETGGVSLPVSTRGNRTTAGNSAFSARIADFTHHADQTQRAVIADTIKHPVGIFRGGYPYRAISQDAVRYYVCEGSHDDRTLTLSSPRQW